jgi:hypothetical protein
MVMTESQRIVLNWRAKLKAMGWPEEAIAEIVKGLCEAGYRACIEEIQDRKTHNERIIASAQQGEGVQN